MDNESKDIGASTDEAAPVDVLVMRNARIRGTHHYSFRSGEWAEILNVVVCKPRGMEERAAFECRYEDGKLDYIAVSDWDNYEIGA